MEMMFAQMSWPQWSLAALIIGVCILLMIVILLQRGRGGGLSGAFGGGGGSAAFGAKTGDVFTWITVGFTTVFVLLTVVANFAFDEGAVQPPDTQQPAADEQAADEGDGDGSIDQGIQAVELGGTPINVKPDGAPTATGAPDVPSKTADENEGSGGTEDSNTDDGSNGAPPKGAGSDADADGSEG